MFPHQTTLTMLHYAHIIMLHTAPTVAPTVKLYSAFHHQYAIYSSGQETTYNNKKPTSYSSDIYGTDSYAQYAPSQGEYATDTAATYNKNTYGAKDTYSKNYPKDNTYSQQQYSARDIYDKKETAYEPSAKF